MDYEAERFIRLCKEKAHFFSKESETIKFWETPLQSTSLLKMLDEMLRQNGIELVFEDIPKSRRSKNQYNTNLSNSFRGKELIYGLIMRMKANHLDPDFETNFVETIAMMASTTKRFKNLTTRDILLYDIQEKEGDPNIYLKMCILMIRCEEDYDEFIRDFKNRLEDKYGPMMFLMKKYKPTFYLEKDILDTADISFLEKKKEKIVRMKNGLWSYYLPADWIRYPIRENLIPQEALSKWVTVYHPMGGFDFSSYGNINVCDDLGPNRYERDLSDYPLDQGIFVTPRLNYIMGLNQHKVNHAAPMVVKHEKDTDYYYALAFECLANPKRIRVPSIFKQSQEYQDKNIYGDYYLVNSPNDLVLRAVLLKRFSTDAYVNFGQGELKANKAAVKFTVKGFESTIDRMNEDEDYDENELYEDFLHDLKKGAVKKAQAYHKQDLQLPQPTLGMRNRERNFINIK